jgi:hypothetical protein
VDKVTVGAACNEPSDCTTNQCGFGAGADPLDCDSSTTCIQCDQNAECPSGRCEGCECEEKLGFDATCNEPSDCQSGKCGPAPTSPAEDCDTDGKCAQCQFDADCAGNRCDDCECLSKLSKGANCDEDSDCTSGSCSTGGKCN